VNRFSWDDTRRYWETHADRRATVEFASDPDGLGNVCHPGAPPWFNGYYAHFQHRTFDRLMASLPPAPAGASALDVGCGAGRWSVKLAARGYAVLGIDLQPTLVDRCRQRLPDHEFQCTPLQDLDTARRFDIATSVTVIQHAPVEAQEAMVERLGALVKPGGHALLLENVADQTPHVFARSIDGWTSLFERFGFRLERLHRYDYSPMNRSIDWLAGRISSRRSTMRPGGAGADPVQMGVARWGTPVRVARRLAVAVDYPVEAALLALDRPLPSTHCGFLFRASTGT